MLKEKLLTTREVSHILEISEKDVIELTKVGKIPHFKLAGEFLRFQKEAIINLKKDIQRKFNISKETVPLGERISGFFYFNDFYILSTIIIVALLWVIFKG
jgi:hypothetical protein